MVVTIPPTGLMAFWADIPPAYRERFRFWHNAEHMPERVGIPGFVEGVRYADLPPDDGFLMTYRTETPAVLGSGPYRAALDSPSDWTQESLPNFQNPVRNIYRLVASEGAALGDSLQPGMVSIRFNLPSDVEGEREGDDFPDIAPLAGAGRHLSLYEIDREISGIATAERAIYGGGPGEQRWLCLIACPLAEIEAEKATEAGAAFRALIDHMSTPWRDVRRRRHVVDYRLRK